MECIMNVSMYYLNLVTRFNLPRENSALVRSTRGREYFRLEG